MCSSWPQKKKKEREKGKINILFILSEKNILVKIRIMEN